MSIEYKTDFDLNIERCQFAAHDSTDQCTNKSEIYYLISQNLYCRCKKHRLNHTYDEFLMSKEEAKTAEILSL